MYVKFPQININNLSQKLWRMAFEKFWRIYSKINLELIHKYGGI